MSFSNKKSNLSQINISESEGLYDSEDKIQITKSPYKPSSQCHIKSSIYNNYQDNKTISSADVDLEDESVEYKPKFSMVSQNKGEDPREGVRNIYKKGDRVTFNYHLETEEEIDMKNSNPNRNEDEEEVFQQNTFRSSSYEEKENIERQMVMLKELNLEVSEKERKNKKKKEKPEKLKINSKLKVLPIENETEKKREVFSKLKAESKEKIDFSKKPIEVELYTDALKRKDRKEKNENDKKNLTQSYKLSNKSYQIAINKIEKLIDIAFESIANKSFEGKIGFFQLGEILYSIKLFRESFNRNDFIYTKSKQNRQAKENEENAYEQIELIKKTKLNKQYLTYKDIQTSVKLLKKREYRKEREILFVEQLWLLLNNEENEFEDDKIEIIKVKEFLKILYSPICSSIHEISEIIESFLEIITRKQSYYSPVIEKVVNKDYIWSIPRLIKEFLNLKENSLAYIEIGHHRKQNENNEFTFKPKISSFAPKETKSKFQLNEMSFEKRNEYYDSIKREKIEKIEKEVKTKEISQCTFKPNISINMRNEKENKEECYERLFKDYIKKNEFIEMEEMRNKEQNELKEMSECTFKPTIKPNFDRKIFQNRMKNRERLAFIGAVQRIQNGILDGLKKKCINER